MLQPIIEAFTVNVLIIIYEWKSLKNTNAMTRRLFFLFLALGTALWIYISIVVHIPRIGNILEQIPTNFF